MECGAARHALCACVWGALLRIIFVYVSMKCTPAHHALCTCVWNALQHAMLCVHVC